MTNVRFGIFNKQIIEQHNHFSHKNPLNTFMFISLLYVYLNMFTRLHPYNFLAMEFNVIDAVQNNIIY